MFANLAHRLIQEHLVAPEAIPRPGEEIQLRIDQTLTQDATGTLVMLTLDALDVDRVAVEVAAQYVDHNLLETDHKNPDDHLFLESACRRYGVAYSPAGGGVSHPVHMQRLGVPGQTLLGSDSHTCAAGGLGMLAIGAGGLDVTLAMIGEPFVVAMPEIWGIELTGELPDWVSAKDVILELLRRHGVEGGLGRILEYHGPGVDGLSAMDRHVIANMGAELGATTSVFPSDRRTRAFLREHDRGDDFVPLGNEQERYDVEDAIDLSALEPLIALPQSPGKVVPVRKVAGQRIYQSYIGSSANPGFRDFAMAAQIVAGQRVPPHVSFDVNPTSRELLLQLMESGHLAQLVAAGARIHQAGCNGCIGMGQAPASGQRSLRTVPRNFPARSGTADDAVYLCSPETAAASALHGVITDPRTLGRRAPVIARAPRVTSPPPIAFPRSASERASLVMGPNIAKLPELGPPPDALELTVAAVLGDHVSTDEILPAGARVLPFRSNIPKIAEFCLEAVAPDYVARAREAPAHAIVAGENYGQGSSREHAALAPRTLGLRLVIARSFARIHRTNLINYGVLPLAWDPPRPPRPGDIVKVRGLARITDTKTVSIRLGDDGPFEPEHGLSEREARIVVAGGRIALHRRPGRAAPRRSGGPGRERDRSSIAQKGPP
ncbi:MAG: aconitate hydratase [Sandaracinaceae bacterium]